MNHKVKHRMLDRAANLKAFLGQDPYTWFKNLGFSYKEHAIGFELRRGDKMEHFDYPFNSEAIRAVLIKFDLDELDAILERTNPPMGSSTGRAIAASLRRLDVEEAKVIHSNDGDKLHQYPELQRWVFNHIGCRSHGVVGCKEKFCQV